jgi:hypothetical protein
MSEILSAVPVRPELSDSASLGIDLDEVESPVVRMGIGYWRRLCNGRPYPTRCEISPRDIRGVLRDTLLLRVLPDDYEFRIVGDAHVIAYGFSMLGRRLGDMKELTDGHRAALKKVYDKVVQRREAFAFRGWLMPGGRTGPRIYSESVLLPLGPDAQSVDHILIFSTYAPRS